MAVNVTITSSYIIDDFYNRSGGGDIYVYSSGGSGTGSSGGGATSLASLSDVALSALSNNQVLTYNLATNKWVNKERGPWPDFENNNTFFDGDSSSYMRFFYDASGNYLVDAHTIVVDQLTDQDSVPIVDIYDMLTDACTYYEQETDGNYCMSAISRDTIKGMWAQVGMYANLWNNDSVVPAKEAWIEVDTHVNRTPIIQLSVLTYDGVDSIDNNIVIDISTIKIGGGVYNEEISWNKQLFLYGEHIYWNDEEVVFGGVTQEYVDGSLSVRDGSISALFTKNTNQDTSINGAYSYVIDLSTKTSYWKSYVDTSLSVRDGSISALFTKNTNIDGSLNSLFTKNTNQDTSINNLRTYVDGSLNSKTSLNTGFYYISASTNITDSSWNGYVIEASGNIGVTFANNLPTGFQATITNVGGGKIKIDASTILSADSSVYLRTRYGACSVAHKGSGIYYAWGNLS